MRFSNELDGVDQGLYWQVRSRADRDEVWKVDMWLLAHDHPGRRSFDLVEPMTRALTKETRTAILALKEALAGGDVHSIEIYERSSTRASDRWTTSSRGTQRAGLWA